MAEVATRLAHIGHAVVDRVPNTEGKAAVLKEIGKTWLAIGERAQSTDEGMARRAALEAELCEAEAEYADAKYMQSKSVNMMVVDFDIIRDLDERVEQARIKVEAAEHRLDTI